MTTEYKIDYLMLPYCIHDFLLIRTCKVLKQSKKIRNVFHYLPVIIVSNTISNSLKVDKLIGINNIAHFLAVNIVKL